MPEIPYVPKEDRESFTIGFLNGPNWWIALILILAVLYLWISKITN
jgi:hypothetical protein